MCILIAIQLNQSLRLKMPGPWKFDIILLIINNINKEVATTITTTTTPYY